MACLFVDQLTVIDAAYLDPQRGLVGESWIVDLELEGALDEQSMVLDFGEVKRRIKRLIDDGPDHTLILPMQDPRLSLRERETGLELRYDAERGLIEHRSPAVAVTRLAAEAVTAESLGAHLVALLAPALPRSIERIGITLRHEAIPGPWYRYTHGLKKHRGACQRIAHGHRSALRIHVGGERRSDLEAAIAASWAEIYLGSAEDVQRTERERLHFAYRAPEGDYALSLPRAACDLLPGDSTVECIAAVLAGRLAAHGPVTVRAFEGVAKGAIARA